MKQNKLTFESENLVVDWIGFNIQSFVFNSTVAKRITGKWKSESLNYASQTQFQVSFRQHEYYPKLNSFWSGCKINFSETKADYLYTLIKQGKLDCNIFKDVSLSRFDIHYFRKSNPVDSNQWVKNFLKSTYNRIRTKSKRKKVSFDPNKEPYILKIGSRSSANYHRVY